MRAEHRDKGDHKHQGRAAAGNNAAGRRDIGGSTGDADDDHHFMDWRPRQSQRCEALGKTGTAGFESSSSAGSAGVESPRLAGTLAVRDSRTSLGQAASQVLAKATAVAAAVTAPVKAYVNPFLAASHDWHPSSDTEDSAEQSDNSIPERRQAAPSNPFAAAAAAAADKWLAARPSSTEHSDDSAEQRQAKTPAHQVTLAAQPRGGASGQASKDLTRRQSDRASSGRSSPGGSPRSRRRHPSAKQGWLSQQPDNWSHEMHSPFESPRLQQRRDRTKAGPPPDKGSFRNSSAEPSSSGRSIRSMVFAVGAYNV